MLVRKVVCLAVAKKGEEGRSNTDSVMHMLPAQCSQPVQGSCSHKAWPVGKWVALGLSAFVI